MLYIVLGTAFILSLATTLALGYPVCRLAIRMDWVDRPDGERKLHSQSTPAIGGIAIAGGFLAGLLYLASIQQILPFHLTMPPPGLWLGAFIMIGVGFYDDVQGLGFRQKLMLQLIAAFLLIHAGFRFDLSNVGILAGDPYLQALYSIPLTALWIVGLINAINLIDGLDGLAAGVTYIALACLAFIFGSQGQVVLVVLVLPLIGALAGFLIHNFRRASMFMGDSGSLFLGFILAAASLQGATHPDPTLSILIPVLVLGLPVLDTGLCILRRALIGRSIFSPDHDHIHHRLARRWSPTRVVMTLYLVALVFGCAAIAMTRLNTGPATLILLTTVLLTVGGIYLLGYFSVLSVYIKRTLEARRTVSANPTSHAELRKIEVNGLKAEPTQSDARGRVNGEDRRIANINGAPSGDGKEGSSDDIDVSVQTSP